MTGINLEAYTLKEKKQKASGTGSFLDVLNRDIKFSSQKFSDKKKERLYSELNILFAAGVDIKTALELIGQEQVKEADKQLVERIKNRIISGSNLSEAMNETGLFSLYEYYSIKIGEESGRLPDILMQLSIFFNKKIKQKRQIINALSYPIIVLVTVIGATVFMMKFVVPMFSDFFKRFNGELPFITKMVIASSEFVSAYFFYLFLAFSAASLALFSQRKKDWFRSLSVKVLIGLPVFGPLVQKIYMARFCQSMNLLTSAKTPLVTSLELVRNMVSFYPIEVSLAKAKEDILKGNSLHSTLSSFKIYNSRMVSLIKVGEEVNQLESIFEKLSKQYNDEVDHETSLLSSLIEPVMIIFLGLLVGTILIAMYLPLFQMSTTIN